MKKVQQPVVLQFLVDRLTAFSYNNHGFNELSK